MVNPSDWKVCFCDAQGDVTAARVVGIRQEGLNPCRMVPSMRDEVHAQQDDVTGKFQSARLRIAALELRDLELKNFFYESKPRFRVNRIPRQGMKDPLSGAQDTSS